MDGVLIIIVIIPQPVTVAIDDSHTSQLLHAELTRSHPHLSFERTRISCNWDIQWVDKYHISYPLLPHYPSMRYGDGPWIPIPKEIGHCSTWPTQWALWEIEDYRLGNIPEDRGNVFNSNWLKHRSNTRANPFPLPWEKLKPPPPLPEG